MPKTTLTLDGKRFVVLSESEYQALKAKAAAKATRSRKPRPLTARKTAGDIAEARRSLANSKRVPAADLFRRLGV